MATDQGIEMSQKLDQLLEGQAQVLAVFTRPDQNRDNTGEGLTSLTIKTNHSGDSGDDLTDD